MKSSDYDVQYDIAELEKRLKEGHTQRLGGVSDLDSNIITDSLEELRHYIEKTGKVRVLSECLS